MALLNTICYNSPILAVAAAVAAVVADVVADVVAEAALLRTQHCCENRRD